MFKLIIIITYSSTVEAFISRHPQETEKVSITGTAGLLQECVKYSVRSGEKH